MGVEFEPQTLEEKKQIRTREIQRESVDKLDQVTDLIDNIGFDNIESDTQLIKEVVVNNLENQANNDDIYEKLEKISQGISDVKRSQTNLNKKINEIQEQIGE